MQTAAAHVLYSQIQEGSCNTIQQSVLSNRYVQKGFQDSLSRNMNIYYFKINIKNTQNEKNAHLAMKIGPYGPELIWHFGT